jgi:hypothetical protein
VPLGLEGIVAKRRDSRYRSGRCREWIKIKNPAHPAIERAMLIALSKRRQARAAPVEKHEAPKSKSKIKINDRLPCVAEITQL